MEGMGKEDGKEIWKVRVVAMQGPLLGLCDEEVVEKEGLEKKHAGVWF